jgi:hypothetical protein
VDGDVTDWDSGPHRDAIACRHFDCGPTAGAGCPADFWDLNHPPVGVASDFNVEALADRWAIDAGSKSLGAAHLSGAHQQGLNGHGRFLESRQTARKRIAN